MWVTALSSLRRAQAVGFHHHKRHLSNIVAQTGLLVNTLSSDPFKGSAASHHETRVKP